MGSSACITPGGRTIRSPTVRLSYFSVSNIISLMSSSNTIPFSAPASSTTGNIFRRECATTLTSSLSVCCGCTTARSVSITFFTCSIVSTA